MDSTRRDLALLLPALAAAARAQENHMLPSKAYLFDDLPVKINGLNKSRAVFNGETHAGLSLELHMTELAAGQAPHPPHQHVHEEIVMLLAGALDTTIKGETTRVTAGSVVYLASNDLHGWRNPGPDPARYLVLAVGKDA